MDVTVASRTGRSRPASEDRWVAVTGAAGLLLAVADGMGGTIAGAAAADAALAGLVEALAVTARGRSSCPIRSSPPRCRRAGRAGRGRTVETRLTLAGTLVAAVIAAEPTAPTWPAPVAAAHASGYAGSPPRGMPVPLRPGTTLTAALVTGRRLRLAHLGDSSCWLLRRGRLRRLTEEHTHAAQLVAAGAVAARLGGPAPARRHARPASSACPARPAHSCATVRLRAGDRLLVATDGVTRPLTVPALATLLARPGSRRPTWSARRPAREGRDDATALLAAVPAEQRRTTWTPPDRT